MSAKNRRPLVPWECLWCHKKRTGRRGTAYCDYRCEALGGQVKGCVQEKPWTEPFQPDRTRFVKLWEPCFTQYWEFAAAQYEQPSAFSFSDDLGRQLSIPAD